MSADAIRALVEFPVQAFKESAQRCQMSAGLRKQQEIHRPSRATAYTGLEPSFKILTPDNIDDELKNVQIVGRLKRVDHETE
jgi:folylpolyglutamate synthase/dihydropteroate synthase